jgi:hypothetical protein
LLYCPSGEDYSDENSVVFQLKNGKNQIFFPIGNYDGIRLDLTDKAGESFTLKSVSIGVQLSSNLRSFFPLFLVWLVILGLVIFVPATKLIGIIRKRLYRLTDCHDILVDKYESNGWRRFIPKCLMILSVVYFSLVIVNFFTERNNALLLPWQRLYDYGFGDYRVLILILAGLCLTAICIPVVKRIHRVGLLRTITVLFVVTFAVRIIAISVTDIIPTGDPEVYYSYAVNFYNGDFDAIASNVYVRTAPSYTITALMYGILGILFGPTIVGIQIGLSIVASISAVFIFLIGNRFSKRVGIIAAFLFAFYPSGVFSVIDMYNSNGSVMFMLIGIYLLLKGYGAEKPVKSLICAGIAFCAAYYCHPSLAVSLMTVTLYTVSLILCLWKNRKKRKKIIINYAILMFTIMITLTAVNWTVIPNLAAPPYSSNQGVNRDQPSPSGLIYQGYVGMRYDTLGQWAPDNGEKNTEIYYKKTVERITDFEKIPSLLFGKMNILWLNQRTEIFTYQSSFRAKYTSYPESYRWLSALMNADELFLVIVYLLFIIGLFVYRKTIHMMPVKSLILIYVLLWCFARLYIEVATRYRLHIIPYIFIIAACGIEYLALMIHRRRERGPDNRASNGSRKEQLTTH